MINLRQKIYDYFIKKRKAAIVIDMININIFIIDSIFLFI